MNFFPSKTPFLRARVARGATSFRTWRRCVALGGLLAAAALPALALDPTEKPSDYMLTRWDAENGLPESHVRQIIQTRDGYLWLGTSRGLARFDGLTFTNFRAPYTPGMLGSTVLDLAETPDGSLWIGTGGGVMRYHEGKFTTYTAADGFRSPNSGTLCVVPDGSLWIGGSSGITRWVDGKFVNDIDTSGFNVAAMQAITVDRQKNVWVAMSTEVLRYTAGRFTRFNSEHGLPKSAVLEIRDDGEGHVIAVAQSGLFVFANERFTPFEIGWKGSRANTSFVDRDGNLWIGAGTGLDRFKDGKIEAYKDPSGMPLGGVDAIYEDREGCLWVGNASGLSRLINRRARTLSAAEGILGTFGLSVVQTRDGSIWCSSWGGGVARFHDGTVKQYRAGAPLSHDTVTSIYEAPNGVMWFGNRGSSVDRMEGDKVTTHVYDLGVATSRFVSAIYDDPETGILIAIAHRGLFNLVDGQYVPIREAAALARLIIWGIHRTHSGRLLLATNGGIFERMPDRSFREVDPPGLPPSTPMRGLLEDADGGMWLATDTRGLVYWKGDKTHVYSVPQGMIDDGISSVVDDGLGSLWVTSTRGLGCIRRTDFDDLNQGRIARLNVVTFGRVEGLESAATPTRGAAPVSARLADGRLIFATGKGMAVVDPAKMQLNSRPPAIVIESVIADDKPLDVRAGQTISIPAGTNRVDVRYTALSLTAPHRLKFRYQLEGSDPAWIEAGGERSAHYTHLSPGRYTFRVLAANNDGIWNNTGESLALIMQPRYYQTLAFRLGVTAFVGLTLASVVGLRIRQYKQRQRALAQANVELDQRVQRRTAELSRSNAELQQRELLFRLIFEHAPVGISWHRADLGPVYHFNAAFRRILDLPAETAADNTLLAELLHPESVSRQLEADRRIRTGEIDSYQLEQRYIRKDGKLVWALLAVAVVRDQSGGVTQIIGILEDITASKDAEAELARTHRRLVDSSRMAGMAEIATGVLHNVGNVLNSVNVSATLVIDRVSHSKAANLAKLSALLDQHKANFAEFVANDPRGQIIPSYVATLCESLAAERAATSEELENLRKNIEHIKEIVAMQQNYAKVSGVAETLSVPDIVEDALRMNAGSLARHDVDLSRDYQARPVITTDKHKVMQILVNLVRNAKYACDESGRSDKRIVVRIAATDEAVEISVIDNGVGVPAENLLRIFNHGFTTRKGGHGFGLHSGALAAKELGGSLTVHSDGPGKGATFTLSLPFKSERNRHAA
jgi:PAS domain S-box-containing protein